MARTKGDSSNTTSSIAINDAAIRSLINLVDELRRLGIHDENETVTYERYDV